MTKKIYSRRTRNEKAWELPVEQSEAVQNLAENFIVWNYHLKQEDKLNEGDWATSSIHENQPKELDIEVTGFEGDFPEGYISEEKHEGDTFYAFGAFSNMPRGREIAERPIFMAEQILEEEGEAAAAGYVMHELMEHYDEFSPETDDKTMQRKAVRNFDQIVENYDEVLENPNAFYDTAGKLGIETEPDILSLKELEEAGEYTRKMGKAYGWF
jgi:hypothetical protein